MIKYFCDRCGKELPSPEDVFWDSKYTVVICLYPSGQSVKDILCRDCIVKIVNRTVSRENGKDVDAS